MRLCREIPKCDPINCKQLDNSWCKMDNTWCYKRPNCEVKTGVAPVIRSDNHGLPLTDKDYAEIDKVILNHDRIDVTIKQKLMKRLNRSSNSVSQLIILRRRKLRYEGKLPSKEEVCL